MLHQPAPAPDIIEEDLDDEVCLYRPADDEVVVLNRTAADVWRLADGRVSLDQIVERLALGYGVDASRIEQDVQEVTANLADRGFLVEAGPAGVV